MPIDECDHRKVDFMRSSLVFFSEGGAERRSDRDHHQDQKMRGEGGRRGKAIGEEERSGQPHSMDTESRKDEEDNADIKDAGEEDVNTNDDVVESEKDLEEEMRVDDLLNDASTAESQQLRLDPQVSVRKWWVGGESYRCHPSSSSAIIGS